MRRLGLAVLSLVASGALVASCEQEMVVVDRGGGGEGATHSGVGGSAVYVATSEAVSTVTGFGGGCPGAPPPAQPLNTCESVTAVAATGGPTLCSACVRDAVGNEFLTQCTDGYCNCYIGDERCFTCESIAELACSVSCCLYPWNAFDSG